MRYAKTFREAWIKIYLATKGRAFSANECSDNKNQSIIEKLQNKNMIEDDRQAPIEEFLEKVRANS